MKTAQMQSHSKYANRKIIRRMLILISLIIAIALALIWYIQYRDIDIRAENSIRTYLYARDQYFDGRSFFGVYECFVGSEDLEYYDEADEELAHYFKKHPERFSEDTVTRYSDFNTFILAQPIRASLRSYMPDKPVDYILICCDVSYYTKLIRNNMLLLFAALAGFILLLFVISRNTIHALDKKDEAMNNFFANASHEMKTPLMAIKGNADGILHGYVEQDKGCEIIEKEADRMSGLISSILDISRLDSGAVHPDLEQNDVREIIYDAISSVMQEAVNRNIELSVDLKEPAFRNCDERMMYSAFSNILTNGLRYADSLIRIYDEKPEEGGIRFVFENDGTPISEEDAAHIFERFYKGDRGQSGIGMALAQEYIMLHGSRIEVGVREGRTAFSIIL